METSSDFGCSRLKVAGLVYPQRTLTATPTCSSYSGTTLYETHVAGLRNLGYKY